MKAHALLLALLTTTPLLAQQPTPTAEHQRLAAQVGVWDAVMKFTDPATGQEIEAKGTSVRKMPLGPLWVLDNFQVDIMGTKFKGHGQTGYDPIKKKYVGSWIDSTTTNLMTFEGTFDDSGKVLTMAGIGVGADGKPAKHRMVTTVVSDDLHTFDMHVTMPDGDEVKTFTITYKRRKPLRDEVDRRRGD